MIPGKLLPKLLLGASTSLLGCAAHAADTAEYQVPRNEYGQPDLRGVWNYSSDVPLQRHKDTPDKLFRTREEIEKGAGQAFASDIVRTLRRVATMPEKRDSDQRLAVLA